MHQISKNKLKKTNILIALFEFGLLEERFMRRLTCHQENDSHAVLVEAPLLYNMVEMT